MGKLFRPPMGGLFSPIMGPVEGGGAVGFNPVSLFAGGASGAWYDPSDLTTLFQDTAATTPVTADGDPVGRINDKSGNGNHLHQIGASTTRPLYKVSAGKSWVESDGVDDFLRATFAISQRWERISAIRQITWAISGRIFGGGSTVGGGLFASGTTPTVAMYSGASAPSTGALTVGSDFVVSEVVSGAASSITVNSGSATVGNSGTTPADGITLFAAETGTNRARARCYGLIMRAGTMDSAQVASMRAYLAAKM